MNSSQKIKEMEQRLKTSLEAYLYTKYGSKIEILADEIGQIKSEIGGIKEFSSVIAENTITNVVLHSTTTTQKKNKKDQIKWE